MLKEFVETLNALMMKSLTPVKVDVGDPRTVAFVYNGELKMIAKMPPPRDHEVDCLDELVKLAIRFAKTVDGVAPVVWYDHGGATLVADDRAHRVDKVAINFGLSEIWTTLSALGANRQWFDQKGFIKLLRIDLAGSIDAGMLLDRVRKIKFESGVATTGIVKRDQESLGKEILARVETTEELPDEVLLNVPVFSTRGLTERRVIRCALEVDPARGAFQLFPFPDEMSRVMDLALDSIGGYLEAELRECGVPVYHGRPES